MERVSRVTEKYNLGEVDTEDLNTEVFDAEGVEQYEQHVHDQPPAGFEPDPDALADPDEPEEWQG